ncbi:hypothetical protein LEP1GSC040_0860 [Leptospira santarosai str. 2000030832]|nr:hypothetical protein LEP1GSC040_0860 [Leptospira santarosai str. 2000030832]
MGEVFPKCKCRKFKVRSLILPCKNFQLNNPTYVGKRNRLRNFPNQNDFRFNPMYAGKR